jgi:hypothetical protein
MEPHRSSANVLTQDTFGECQARDMRFQPLNFLMASSVTGVKRFTRLPSGSRNRIERLPHGIVVGACTHSVTSGLSR